MLSSSHSYSAANARAALAVAAWVAALLATGKAHANWDFNPRIELGASYDDNYRLAESGTRKIPAYGSLVDASFAARLLDPRSEIDIVPRVHSSFFPDDHEDQSTDGYLDVTGNYRTQKATFGGVFNYSNETVIASELLPADFPGVGLGQVVGEATGRVSVHNRRQLERAAPTMTYDFTPRWHLKAGAEYEQASFDNNVRVPQPTLQSYFIQEGFKDVYGNAGLQYDFSQRNDLVVSLTGGKFIPDGSPTTTERYGVQGQWESRPNSVVQYYVRAGIDQIHANTLVDGVINKTVAVGGAGVTMTYQLSQYVIDAIRDLAASASGAVVDHEEVRFRVLRALRPRLYTVLAARYARVRSGSTTILAIQGSDYVAASAALQYQLTQSFRLSTEYDYTWQRFQGEPNAASNGIAVSVIWQPLSRFNPLPDYNRLPMDRPQ